MLALDSSDLLINSCESNTEEPWPASVLHTNFLIHGIFLSNQKCSKGSFLAAIQGWVDIFHSFKIRVITFSCPVGMAEITTDFVSCIGSAVFWTTS